MQEAINGTWKVVRTSPLTLPVHAPLYRMPPRDWSKIDSRYMSKYDGHTLACDVFTFEDELCMIGPPLLNLQPAVSSAEALIDGAERIASVNWTELDRASRARVETKGIAEHFSLSIEGIELECQPTSAQHSLFQGRNVAVTMNKDNRLENIRDWAQNLTTNHEVTAIIVYDNRSADYSPSQIVDSLRTVSDLEVGIVVDWPYKFGNLTGDWSSDFGQYMCWEHARWRFCRTASCVIIGDVDEFPISEDGRTLVQVVQDSPSGAILYPVRNAPPVPRYGLDPGRIRLHSDYLYMDTVRGTFSKKVAYIPSRVPDTGQIGNHYVKGVKNLFTNAIISRHVNGVHLSWRTGKSAYSDQERSFNESTEEYDSLAEKTYRSTFPDRFSSATASELSPADYSCDSGENSRTDAKS